MVCSGAKLDARSALRTDAYFKTVGNPAISVSTASLAAQNAFAETTITADHDTAWFGEPWIEISLASDHYDFVLSLIHLEEAVRQGKDEFEEVGDVFDRTGGARK